MTTASSIALKPIAPRSSSVEQPARSRARIPSNSVLPAITNLAEMISFRRRALRMTWFYTGRTRLGGPDLQGLPNRPSRPVTTLREDLVPGVPPRPDSPANFQERFSQALLASEGRVLLLGGVACNVHGSSRHTLDVDYWLDPSGGPSAWAARLLAMVRTTGDPVEISQIQGPCLGRLPAETFEVLVASTASAAATDGVIRLSSNTPCASAPLRETPTAFDDVSSDESVVDLFYEANNLPDFEAAWKRSRPLDGTLRVLCREDLIASKRGTGRKQDEDDIRFLESLP
ncbi:MAG: hypothetical protein ACOYMV_10350 [Verrucomicrobiia bacterium]